MSRLRREVLVFLIVGGTTVLIDFLFYTILLWSDVAHAPAKAAGFITGTVFAYFANRIWTFQARHTSLRNIVPFCILYCSTLLVNVGTNAAVLAVLGTGRVSVFLAFLSATGISAILNFVGMKFFVFGEQYGKSNSTLTDNSLLQRGKESSSAA